MLETTATRLWSEPGGPHYGSPDKEPAVRLRVLDDAGRVGVPFTTGILIGIGETRAERAESLFAIRAAAREYGHVQEVIVQNFRAKPDTAMANDPDAELRRPGRHHRGRPAACSGRRCGSRRRPTSSATSSRCMLRAGIDDWGGVSPVTAGPRQPGAALARDRRARRALGRGRVHAAGAAHGLPAVRAGRARRGSTRGCTRTSRRWPTRRPGWPRDGAAGRAGRGRSRTAGSPRPAGPTCTRAIDTDGPHRRPARRLRLGLRRLGRAARGARRRSAPRRRRAPARLGRRPSRAGLRARRRPTRRRCSTRRTTDAALALFLADGPALDELAAARRRRAPRRRSATTSPTSSTATSTSPTSATWAAGSARSPSASATPTRTGCRWTRSPTARSRRPRAGATEVCMQGGIDPQLPVTFYADLVRAVQAAVPGMHVHAFSPDGDRDRGGEGRRVDPGVADRAARRPGSTRSRAPPPRSSTTRCAGCSPRASCRRRSGSRW